MVVSGGDGAEERASRAWAARYRSAGRTGAEAAAARAGLAAAGVGDQYVVSDPAGAWSPPGSQRPGVVAAGGSRPLSPGDLAVDETPLVVGGSCDVSSLAWAPGPAGGVVLVTG